MIKKIKLEIGNILSINLGNSEYAFARVLSKMDIGHCIEIFDFIGNNSDEYTKVNFDSRLLPPQIIDSHSIFWMRKEGDWELEVQQKDFSPPKDDPRRFEYGHKHNLKLVDIFDNTEAKDKNDDNRYPPYSPQGDTQVKRIIKFWRDKNSSSNSITHGQALV